MAGETSTPRTVLADGSNGQGATSRLRLEASARQDAPPERRPQGQRAMPAPSFASFAEFYPFYLAEHANRTSRRLHVIGTLGAVIQLLVAAVTSTPWLLLSALVSGYGFAWVGHYAFEKNRPATFKYPLYSLRGDFTMARDVLVGRIAW